MAANTIHTCKFAAAVVNLPQRVARLTKRTTQCFTEWRLFVGQGEVNDGYQSKDKKSRQKPSEKLEFLKNVAAQM